MVIVDTGPLVALFDESEPAHQACLDALQSMRAPLITTWPVLTESFYLLSDWQKGQTELWEFILSGGLTIAEIPASYCGRLGDLMRKYRDKPMDLADATLVVLAEIHKARVVFTLDRRDFSVYRPRHLKHFDLIPER
jgi:predicted nucleic acid-binding protein